MGRLRKRIENLEKRTGTGEFKREFSAFVIDGRMKCRDKIDPKKCPSYKRQHAERVSRGASGIEFILIGCEGCKEICKHALPDFPWNQRPRD